MADPDSHILLLYEYVEDMVDRRAPHREAHLARITEQREAGRVVMAGALGDPPIGGALVFRGRRPRAGRERSCAPIRTSKAGLVTAWRIEPWKLV